MSEDVVEIGSPRAAGMCPATCRRHAVGRRLLGLAGWLTAACTAVAVAFLPFDAGESLCGIWGCFPPVTALAALHLLWAVGFAMTVWTVTTEWPAALRPLGWLLVFTAVATAAAVPGRDVFRWFDHVPAEDHHYWPRRLGYTLATRTDVPLAQTLAAGVAYLMLGRRVGVDRAAPSTNQPAQVVNVLVPSSLEKS
ncbi:hypothetical protein [Limnoglobus roseus]|uniref:Uncharacterized protein n=1 Tax=Limnoglobus roseus TaxID=2598579 RepID=A0A5C1AHV6_9BACT|nr:hypothetical protein [Limnoglobus roseus]QEL17757.1 hypothetical protein PX52LOC_04761 [Limnoglobus roseus]